MALTQNAWPTLENLTVARLTFACDYEFRVKAIEVGKKTRDGMTAQDLGAQLIVDIARYMAHPDCRMLFCFAYDPEGRIGNPHGLENDPNALSTGELGVVTLIEPSYELLFRAASK